jgi:hypothetical protein
MWNDIKKFLAATNWKALVFAVVVQLTFTFLVWDLLFAHTIGWLVPYIIRMVVNLVVFIVAYVGFDRIRIRISR